MSDDPTRYHSEIDARFALPGDERLQLAIAVALEAATTEDPSFASEGWAAVASLDAAAGFGTRLAARALLRRPSDSRFLIFRYPFRDGSFRFVLPGGGVEPGETAKQAVTREVFEETGAYPADLAPSGLLLFHLLASTIYGADRTPTIQYSPVLTGTIADELPDTQHREARWFSIEEFEEQPRRPISDPLMAILRRAERGERGERIEPRAIWLPA